MLVMSYINIVQIKMQVQMLHIGLDKMMLVKEGKLTVLQLM